MNASESTHKAWMPYCAWTWKVNLKQLKCWVIFEQLQVESLNVLFYHGITKICSCFLCWPQHQAACLNDSLNELLWPCRDGMARISCIKDLYINIIFIARLQGHPSITTFQETGHAFSLDLGHVLASHVTTVDLGQGREVTWDRENTIEEQDGDHMADWGCLLTPITTWGWFCLSPIVKSGPPVKLAILSLWNAYGITIRM